ncbi:MAG TPA: DUF1659 domain-containing protein [Candidatus Atribacteria bacterium]|jgi:hypothetical protein|uniref:DUF1659 domain-containing protein n=1 Tax=Candidatus Sordicultor fermentans TaxID=1953203 RepID=UPI001696D417|nr:DUF1659 domain-containing protein [Candidatus Atribacteria bacterium]HOQ51971.1 DUF1659 domain-containing protein [Candidatus Atribacteria bacterium]HPT64200.1 DUF1659 domain-containing protein [Candidatus Atribacteria bacterium]
MAIITELPNRIRLRFQVGFTDTGNPKYATQSFSKVKEDASHDDIYDVANGIASLCGYDLEGIYLEEDKLMV